jgi:hypothetical protein
MLGRYSGSLITFAVCATSGSSLHVTETSCSCFSSGAQLFLNMKRRLYATLRTTGLYVHYIYGSTALFWTLAASSVS